MDAESNLAEVAVASNNGSTSGEPQDPTVLKEKLADELKSAASLKGGGDGPELDVPLEKDDLLERLDKIETDSSETVTKPSTDGTAASNNDADSENDDLIQRLEAMEKGEEEASTVEKKDEAVAATATETAETNHQNGLEKENEAELLQEDEPTDKVEEKMEVDGGEDKKEEVSSTEPTSNGAPSLEATDSPTNSVKRRHSQDEETTEPSTKKAHVEEVDSAEKAETSDEKTMETEVVAASKANEANKETAEKVEESAKTEETPVAESTVTEEETKAKKPEEDTSDNAASSKGLAKEDEKPAEDAPKVEENVKETEEPMESSEVTEQPAKQEEAVVAEQKEEVDSTPVAETSESATEPEKAAETETKVDSEPVAEEEKQVEEEVKAQEPVESVPEEKPSEEAKVEESVAAVAEELPEKVEEVKEAETAAKPTEEPTTSESVVEATKLSEEKKEEAESEQEQTAKEVESESEALPDTEPNTESSQEEQPTSSSPAVVEEKSDEAISSSSEQKEEQALPSSTEVDSAVSAAAEQPAEKLSEVETVTSSDEKPSTEPSVAQEVDSTPEVAAPAADASEPAKDDEPMEVDSEPVVEESSQVDAVEPPCTKKEAYQCTDDSEAKQQESTTTEAASESTSAPVPEKESAQKDADQEDEKMEVDSAAPSQSKPDPDVTESMNTTSEELIESLSKDDTATVADSQSETAATVSEHNKNLDAGEASADDSKVDVPKTLDDSIECSLPTSSSDKMADRLKQRLDLMSNGSSTPNAAVSSSNVYNSTPIQKQFEISSENVSKISHSDSHQADEDHSAITVGDQSITDEKEAAVASTSGLSKPPAEAVKQQVTDTSDDTSITVKDSSSSVKTMESSEVDSCTASSGLNTADEINMYATNARKFNGISSTSGSELEDKSIVTPAKVSTTDTPATVVNKLDLVPALTSEEATYEVSVWFDGTELQFLSIEKMENKQAAASATAGSTQDLTGIDSSKQSSNGSVGSLGPFSLPARPTTDSALSHSTATETSSGTSQIKASLPKMKHTVRGAKALATLMIEEFTKIQRALSKDDDVSDTEPATPMKTPKGRPPSKKATTATPASARGQKRSRTDSETTEEEPSKSKQPAKQAKKGAKAEPEVPETSEPAAKKEDEQCCLARWSDRKYYAGKVAGFKGDNKYMIVFEDGASKALAKDVIVFGEKDTLPIMGHSVHALTGGDTYEPGIVEEIKRNDSNEVVYSVKIDTGVVEVTASDMYLTEEQAKHINKACKAAEGATDDSTSMQSPQTSGRRGGANTPIMQTPEEAAATSAEKGSRSSRRRGADKPQTPVTPEAGYSGGVGGKKTGRRGRRLS